MADGCGCLICVIGKIIRDRYPEGMGEAGVTEVIETLGRVMAPIAGAVGPQAFELFFAAYNEAAAMMTERGAEAPPAAEVAKSTKGLH